MSRNNNFTPKKMIGASVKILLVAVVLMFLGLQSINFFSFTFPEDQWYYAYLGFGMTSGGVIAYLIIFLSDADTPMKQTIALGMLAVCVIGELATAGFGMQVEAWRNSGLEMSASDFRFMIIAVQILGLFHGLALLFYFAGDRIIKMFQDDDRDGIPNFADRDYHQDRMYANDQMDPTRRQ